MLKDGKFSSREKVFIIRNFISMKQTFNNYNYVRFGIKIILSFNDMLDAKVSN